MAVHGLESYGAEGKVPLANEEKHVISTAMADDDERVHDKGNTGNENELWEETHEFLANFTLFLVFTHILGVLISGAIHRENLIKAMITGNKRAIGITNNHYTRYNRFKSDL